MAIFTKQHFERVADYIATRTKNIEDREAFGRHMIRIFREDNENFNEARFRKAADLSEVQ